MDKYLGCALVCFLLAVMPQKVLATGVTPEEVETLTGAAASAPKLDQDNFDRSLDRQAARATLELGQGDPQWNDKNEKWQPIFTKVRADMAVDSKPMIEYSKQSHQEIDALIAAHLDPADVKAIDDYLKTDEGKRYNEFSKKVDHLIHESLSPLLGQAGNSTPSSIQPSKEQVDKDMRLLVAARPVQVLMATMQNSTGHDSHAADVFALTQAMTIKMHHEEIEDLNNEYGGDIEKFNGFNRSAAQQHLFSAMAIAMRQISESMQSLVKAQQPSEQQHRAEWLAMYQHDVEGK